MEAPVLSSNHRVELDRIVKINCGGREFHTLESTISKLPGTRLCQLVAQRQSHPNYREDVGCFYFDRSPEAFASILNYYRTDELHISDNFCGNAMKEELEFWGLNESEIEPCCWGNYARFQSHKETLNSLESTFGGGDDIPIEQYIQRQKSTSCWKRFQSKVWVYLEYPSSSRLAKVIMFISMFIVAVSIIETILESHFFFRVIRIPVNGTQLPAPNPQLYRAPDNAVGCDATDAEPLTMADYPLTDTHPSLDILDDVCMAFFIVEFIVRVIFAPYKKNFFRSALNIIDMVCLVPQIISTIIKHTVQYADITEADNSRSYSRAGDILKAVTMLRTVRILRIFKLMKHYSAFKILAYTVKVSTKELLLMVVYLMTLVLIFACVIHYAEQDNFDSIPIGLWWALVTMTTVGYGDKHPKKLLGYIVGCICVICGVLVIAFTVPIVVNNFALYYTHAKTRTKLPKTTVLEQRNNNKGESKKQKSVRIRQTMSRELSRSTNLTTLSECDAEGAHSTTPDCNTSLPNGNHDNNVSLTKL